jgi:hypothetical protein
MGTPQGGISPAMAEHRRLVVWWLTGAGTLLVILPAFGDLRLDRPSRAGSAGCG